MILFLLSNGEYTEVPDAVDVVRRGRVLECLNAAGEVIGSFLSNEVRAYTKSPASARWLKGEEAGVDGDEVEPAR